MKLVLVLCIVLLAITACDSGTSETVSPVKNDTFVFVDEQNEESCTTDSDCKLIYSSCDCKAVHLNSTEELDYEYPLGRICEINRCDLKDVVAVCKNGRCVRSDSVSK